MEEGETICLAQRSIRESMFEQDNVVCLVEYFLEEGKVEDSLVEEEQGRAPLGLGNSLGCEGPEGIWHHYLSQHSMDLLQR